MALSTTSRAADLLHGCVGCAPEGEGWVRPVRFTTAQLRALGSVRAWHPGLYKRMAACTAGVCLEFETDASHVSVEVALGAVPRGTVSTMRDVERHSGSAPDPGVVSVEIDDLPPVAVRPDDRHLVEIDLSEPGADPTDPVALPGMGRRRRVRVWLPCLTTCAVRDVFFDGGYLGPVAERRALLVLGDSIAQGFVADQPAATWPALLARRAGLDLVNQGIGGQVFQPGSLWGMEELDPAAIVVEFGENYRYEPCAASAIGRDVRAYLSEVALAWPETLAGRPHLGAHPAAPPRVRVPHAPEELLCRGRRPHCGRGGQTPIHDARGCLDPARRRSSWRAFGGWFRPPEPARTGDDRGAPGSGNGTGCREGRRDAAGCTVGVPGTGGAGRARDAC